MKQIIVTLFLLLSIPVIAQYNMEPRTVSRSRQVFDNTNCAATNTCDLIQVRYLAEDYEIFAGGGMHYGTRLFAHYVTDTVDALENYAFVQFIKGCQYSSHDTKEVLASISRNHFSKNIIFNHKDWVVDSTDTDPIYFSTPNSRHFNYKRNIKPGSTDKETMRYYGLEKPNYPELYITDRPGTAFYMNNGAKNISLNFKICLYRTSDVPRETVPENIDFSEPITCFYWDSSWVYDHDMDTYKHPHYVVSACSTCLDP